jgi:hypothetical protein
MGQSNTTQTLKQYRVATTLKAAGVKERDRYQVPGAKTSGWSSWWVQTSRF